MQIRFDKLKKKTGVLRCALIARLTLEPPLAAPKMQLNVLAGISIGQKSKLEKEENQTI